MKFKPLVDKYYWTILAVSLTLIVGMTVLMLMPPALVWYALAVDALVIFLAVSPLFGYVELREESLFIRFGIFLKKEIPYSKIRGAEKVRRSYADSTVALKTSLEHINVKHAGYEVTSISVKDGDLFIEELLARAAETKRL